MNTPQLISTRARVLAAVVAIVVTALSFGSSLSLAEHYASSGFQQEATTTQFAQRIVVTAQRPT